MSTYWNRGPVSVYRIYDADGALIYIGQSAAPLSRLDEHTSQRTWRIEIASVVVDWYETRAEARDAESKAISAENPRWNTHHISPKARKGKAKALGVYCEGVDILKPSTWVEPAAPVQVGASK